MAATGFKDPMYPPNAQNSIPPFVDPGLTNSRNEPNLDQPLGITQHRGSDFVGYTPDASMVEDTKVVPFSRTTSSFSIEQNGVLTAWCKYSDWRTVGLEEHRKSTLDLNTCIGVGDGQLVVKKGNDAGPSGFLLQSRNLRLRGPILVAEVQGDAGHHDSELDLDKYVRNEGGVLEFCHPKSSVEPGQVFTTGRRSSITDIENKGEPGHVYSDGGSWFTRGT